MILKTHTCLLTYQGDWGVLDVDHNVVQGLRSDQLTVYVRESEQAQSVWQTFLTFAENLAADLHAPSWASCLEICLKTFEEQQQVRVHLHLFLKSEVQQLRCTCARKLQFKYSDPHVKDTLWGKKVARANWAGAYYCLAPKRGSVFRHGTIRSFIDFPIDPSWIFNMIEGEKIDYHAARGELIQCGKGLVRRLADLDAWHKAKQERLVEEMVSKAQASSRAQLQKFPRWPLVDAWLVAATKPLQPRKMLGLAGPATYRQNSIRKGTFPLGTVLELNCANLQVVCLDGFDCLRHQAILWDEASACLVCNNRKIFQRPLCKVDLGRSPTGAHVKRYFLGNCCSIITTNKWYEDLKKLSAGDRQWLEANTVVFDVQQPLWENSRELDSCELSFSALQI